MNKRGEENGEELNANAKLLILPIAYEKVMAGG